MEKLVDWFISHGGSMDKSAMALADIPNQGRGAIALKDLPKDHTLFSIPRDLTLSTRTSRLPHILGNEVWTRFQLNKGWSGIILCMMWEEAQGDDSRWSTYLSDLPVKFDTPIFWSEDDLRELQGCALVDKLGKQEAENNFNTSIAPLLKTREDLFDPSLLSTTYSLLNYHVMGSRLLSRSFQVEKWEGDGTEAGSNAVDGTHGDSVVNAASSSDDMAVDGEDDENTAAHGDEEADDSDEEDDEDPTDVAMVPMADMLNARYESENAKLFHEATHLKMITTKPIKAGDQIYNTYGDLPNSDLLRRYGHVDVVSIPGPKTLMGNPADIVEVPADLISSSVAVDFGNLRERIDWWLDEGGDDVFVLDNETLVPDVLVSFSKLLILSDNEWEKVRSKSKPPKPKLDDDRTFSMILGALQKRLDQYPTSLEDDEETLRLTDSNTLSLNKLNAIVVRVGEKRILKNAIDRLSQLQLDLKPAMGREERGDSSASAKRKRLSNDGKSQKKGKR